MPIKEPGASWFAGAENDVIDLTHVDSVIKDGQLGAGVDRSIGNIAGVAASVMVVDGQRSAARARLDCDCTGRAIHLNPAGQAGENRGRQAGIVEVQRIDVLIRGGIDGNLGHARSRKAGAGESSRCAGRAVDRAILEVAVVFAQPKLLVRGGVGKGHFRTSHAGHERWNDTIFQVFELEPATRSVPENLRRGANN